MQQRTTLPFSLVLLMGVLNFIPGAWLILAPFVLGYSAPQEFWNDVLIGIVLMGAALIRYHQAVPVSLVGWIRIGLGLWLIAAPWVLRYVTPQAYWNDTIAGIVVVALGGWSVLMSPARRTAATR